MSTAGKVLIVLVMLVTIVLGVVERGRVANQHESQYAHP